MSGAADRKTRSVLFERAEELVSKYKLIRICTFSNENELKRLTICNLWRVELGKDCDLRAFRFDLKSAKWLESDNFDLRSWPEIPFAPIWNKSTQSLNWGFRLCKTALRAALRASGIAFSKREEIWIEGLISPASIHIGARTLRAVWWDHFVDREVLSALLCSDPHTWTVAKYLQYARYRPALLKVAAERRNLLPVLMEINPQQWGRDDLFSRKLWARDGSESTLLDRELARFDRGFHPIYSFETVIPWRWLSKSSSLIVREWVAVKNNSVIEDLALANCGGIHAPVCAYVKLIRSANRAAFPKGSPLVLQFYRLFLKTCAQIWKEKGFSAVRQWLRDDPESDILLMADYLHAEGFAQGLPDKNSSWTSLLRRSEDWHRRTRELERAMQAGRQEVLQWDSLLPETVIDGVVCTPLTDSQALDKEGYEMSHCVSSYAERCHHGVYRVFALRKPDGAKSTLGLRLEYYNKTVVSFDQHRGPSNSQVSSHASDVARKLLNAYRQALAAKL